MATALPRPLPGGPLAIDLINTVWLNGAGPFDWLESDVSVETFLEEYGHGAGGGAHVAAVREALTEARSLVRRLMQGGALEPFGSGDDLTNDVNRVLESSKAVVVFGGDGPAVRVTGDRPHNGLAIEAIVSAVELRRNSAERIRVCAHDDCVLWFLDTSKSGRRRWCSMDRCGNRAKAQRHYRRSTQPEG